MPFEFVAERVRLRVARGSEVIPSRKPVAELRLTPVGKDPDIIAYEESRRKTLDLETKWDALNKGYI